MQAPEPPHPHSPQPPSAAAPAAPNPLAAATPPYLEGAPDAFIRQADVCFVAAGGQELPAHSQFLARCCDLFGELLDPEGGVQQQPSAAAPLHVPMEQHSGEDVGRVLLAAYQPHLTGSVVTSLRTPAAYGAVLDVAAYLRFGRLLDGLRAPLATRSARMGELVGFDFPAWLDVADRHHLPQLRSYCLECLLHLLVAPGCSRQLQEPGIEQLDWGMLSKDHLLLLLDGLASATRRCTHSSYELRVRVPCTSVSSSTINTSATYTAAESVATGPMPVGSHSGGSGGSPVAAGPAGAGWGYPPPSSTTHAPPASPSTPLGTSAVGALFTSMGAPQAQHPPALYFSPPQGAPVLPPRDHITTVAVAKLRQADAVGSLPGEAEIDSWRHMGDMCQAVRQLQQQQQQHLS